MSWCDRQNRAEIPGPEYPGERLVVCLDPLRAQRRRQKRQSLLAATEKVLSSLAAQAARSRQKGRPMRGLIPTVVENSSGSDGVYSVTVFGNRLSERSRHKRKPSQAGSSVKSRRSARLPGGIQPGWHGRTGPVAADRVATAAAGRRRVAYGDPARRAACCPSMPPSIFNGARYKPQNAVETFVNTGILVTAAVLEQPRLGAAAPQAGHQTRAGPPLETPMEYPG